MAMKPWVPELEFPRRTLVHKEVPSRWTVASVHCQAVRCASQPPRVLQPDQACVLWLGAGAATPPRLLHAQCADLEEAKADARRVEALGGPQSPYLQHPHANALMRQWDAWAPHLEVAHFADQKRGAPSGLLHWRQLPVRDEATDGVLHEVAALPSCGAVWAFGRGAVPPSRWVFEGKETHPLLLQTWSWFEDNETRWLASVAPPAGGQPPNTRVTMGELRTGVGRGLTAAHLKAAKTALADARPEGLYTESSADDQAGTALRMYCTGLAPGATTYLFVPKGEGAAYARVLRVTNRAAGRQWVSTRPAPSDTDQGDDGVLQWRLFRLEDGPPAPRAGGAGYGVRAVRPTANQQ